MTRTILLAIDVSGDTDLNALADDCAEACTQAGIPVISAKPIRRLPTPTPLAGPTSPPVGAPPTN